MKDISNQTFQYAGKKYTFTASLYSFDGKINVILDNAAVKLFEYESSMNELVHKGSIHYIDAYGAVDKLIEKNGAYCEILLVENEQKMDGSVTIEKLSETNILATTFLIENIGILNRQSNQIEYKIDLISDNIYKCMATVDFSNYGKDPQQLFDILRECYVQAGLEIEPTSFSNVKTDVKLNYITNGNDNVFSVTKYIMNKLYYYGVKDDSLKFIFWNETLDKVQLFDIKNNQTQTGFYSILLSFLKSKHESLIEAEPAGIGTVTKFSASQTISSMFKMQISDYNYDKNIITRADVSSKNLAQYFNETFNSDDTILNKQNFIEDNKDNNYTKRGAYWNNDFDIYENMVKLLTKNNAILVETSGEILRKPGALVNIVIDRDKNELTTESGDDLDDIMTRYRGLEGSYFLFRSHHYVFPMQSRYRQALTLVRNFTIDMANKSK